MELSYFQHMLRFVTIHITYKCHDRDKISNTIELFREVTHPLAKGEEAGKIFAKYEQLYAGLAM